ncbi:hypothetical protein ABZ570_32305 [Micromonospora sp. NPDC007271]|uniref:hypothetical protein n=1 Tax=Micromonospora sp. NPDC007271 TaxID=3154587 RepID=UPI0033F476BD
MLKQNLKTGDLAETVAVTRRFDLTDVQWAVLQPLLPPASDQVDRLRGPGGN